MDIDGAVFSLKTDLSSLEKALQELLYTPVYNRILDVNREPVEAKRVFMKYIGTFNGNMEAYYHCVDMLMDAVANYKSFVYMMTEDDAHELTGKILACRDVLVSLPSSHYSKPRKALAAKEHFYKYYAKVAPLTKGAYLGDKLNKLYSEAP